MWMLFVLCGVVEQIIVVKKCGEDLGKIAKCLQNKENVHVWYISYFFWLYLNLSKNESLYETFILLLTLTIPSNRKYYLNQCLYKGHGTRHDDVMVQTLIYPRNCCVSPHLRGLHVEDPWLGNDWSQVWNRGQNIMTVPLLVSFILLFLLTEEHKAS